METGSSLILTKSSGSLSTPHFNPVITRNTDKICTLAIVLCIPQSWDFVHNCQLLLLRSEWLDTSTELLCNPGMQRPSMQYVFSKLWILNIRSAVQFSALTSVCVCCAMYTLPCYHVFILHGLMHCMQLTLFYLHHIWLIHFYSLWKFYWRQNYYITSSYISNIFSN